MIPTLTPTAYTPNAPKPTQPTNVFRPTVHTNSPTDVFFSSGRKRNGGRENDGGRARRKVKRERGTHDRGGRSGNTQHAIEESLAENPREQ